MTSDEVIKDTLDITVDEPITEKSSLDPIPTDDCFPTGIDLLNLTLSGSCYGGFRKGSVIELMAESGVGKTLFALNLMKTAIEEDGDRFSNYRFIYIDKESGCNFTLSSKVRERIEIYDASNSNGNLATIERTFNSILNWLDGDKPCVIVLDSLNAFVSEAIMDSIEKNQKIVADNKTADLNEARMASVAQASSKYMPLICEKLKKTKSMLILISQFRDNMTASASPYQSFMDQRRVSGGRAIKYFGDYRICFRQGKVLKKKAETGRELVQAYEIHIDTLKNRGTGVTGTINVPFRGTQLQIGNVKSMFDYLVETKQIEQAGARYKADWVADGKSMFEADFRRQFQTNPDLVKVLREKCAYIWRVEQESLNDIF